MVNERKSGAKKAPETREDRLKKALKANMARRKSQARARAAAAPEDEQQSNETKET
ncbi:MAG: hypothetical protein AAFP28_04020 [Pseudomonadota bacterium]